MSQAACPTCGRPLDDHNRHLRFTWPEPVLTVPEHERQSRTWGNDVLMQVEGIGAFVRVLIPIKLTGGFTLTYGAWLSIHPNGLRHAWEIWQTPAYRDLRPVGILANKLPPWPDETYRKPLEAAVRNLDHVPYAIDSADKFMRKVISEEWPHSVLDSPR